MSKPRRIRMGWLAGLLLTVHAAPAASPALPASTAALRFSVSLSKDTFEEGEPIVVTLRLLNLSDQSQLVQTSSEETGVLDGYRLWVTRADGTPLAPPRHRVAPLNCIGSWYTIPPYGEHERTLFLNYWVRPLVPGDYRLRASYQPHLVRSPEDDEPELLSAAALPFSVAPATDEKMEVRVRRSTAQARQGDVLAIDFLGFTGATDAAAPLLETLARGEPELQRRAANALACLADRPLVHLQALQQARTDGAAAIFARWLAAEEIDGEILGSLFLIQAQSPDVRLRVGALTGLRLIHDRWPHDPAWREDVRQLALAGLADRYGDVRREAVLLLALDRDQEAVEALVGLLKKEPNRSVRQTLTAVLSRQPAR